MTSRVKKTRNQFFRSSRLRNGHLVSLVRRPSWNNSHLARYRLQKLMFQVKKSYLTKSMIQNDFKTRPWRMTKRAMIVLINLLKKEVSQIYRSKIMILLHLVRLQNQIYTSFSTYKLNPRNQDFPLKFVIRRISTWFRKSRPLEILLKSTSKLSI